MDYTVSWHLLLWLKLDAKIMPVLESPCWELCYIWMALRKYHSSTATELNFPFPKTTILCTFINQTMFGTKPPWNIIQRIVMKQEKFNATKIFTEVIRPITVLFISLLHFSVRKCWFWPIVVHKWNNYGVGYSIYVIFILFNKFK